MPHAICTFWPGCCRGSCFWIKKNKSSFSFKTQQLPKQLPGQNVHIAWGVYPETCLEVGSCRRKLPFPATMCCILCDLLHHWCLLVGSCYRETMKKATESYGRVLKRHISGHRSSHMSRHISSHSSSHSGSHISSHISSRVSRYARRRIMTVKPSRKYSEKQLENGSSVDCVLQCWGEGQEKS